MILTTGYDIQGYFITQYIDVIFDEMLVGLGFGKSILSGLDNLVSSLTGTEATEMINKLNDVKQQLRKRLIQKAQQLGADALIGIDFESSRLGDLIMVSMTATAVKLDKIESPLPVLQSSILQTQKAEQQKKLEEEKAQRLAKAQEAGLTFDSSFLLKVMEDMNTTKELVSFITEQAQQHPEIFDETLIAQLTRCANLERIYGDCRSDAIKIVRKHLDTIQQ